MKGGFPTARANVTFGGPRKPSQRPSAPPRSKIFGSMTPGHTFASRLAMEGVDLLALKALGGWKTLSMVQRYAHLSPGHQRSAIERLVTRQRTREAAQAAGTEWHRD